MTRIVALVCAALFAATGCADEPDPTAKPPTLGGAVPTGRPPAGTMDKMEQPIAAELATQVAGQGLHVDLLECPAWDGTVPASFECTGWFDKVEGVVSVTLTRDKGGKVAFDAELLSGVIATKNLVDELVDKGYDEVDCGSAPAYATEVGNKLTCRGRLDGKVHYLKVTITDIHGGVTITEL